MARPPPSRPRSAIYDGRFYALMVESMMKDLHRLAGRTIPDGARVLDACCGTGGLALQLAERCREVVGVDLSPRQIKQARRAAGKRGMNNVSFVVGDVAHLDQFNDQEFECASLVMAVHEMPPDLRAGVIRELLRVAGKLTIVDFKTPMHWNWAGIRNRFMELAAGFRHFGYYRDYAGSGGLAAVLDTAGARLLEEKITDRGNISICVVSPGSE